VAPGPHSSAFTARPRFFRGRRGGKLIREAVDRLVTEERIDTGVAIKGEKLARVPIE
jgi:hypothetical protein